MPRLFGRDYTKRELLQKVGDIRQIGCVALYELADGPERSVRCAEFRTGTGFTFSVALDRGMDIPLAEYGGRSLCWMSSTGITAPSYYEPEGRGWLRSFFGGLLTTCGLTYLGAPCIDEGLPLGLHGRVSNLPARCVHTGEAWVSAPSGGPPARDDYLLWVEGRVRETSVFGENLELTRRITARLGETRLVLSDSVENLGFHRTPHMILYHFNLGFPLLDSSAELLTVSPHVTPRDEAARLGLDAYPRFTEPIAGFQEQVFYHDLEADDQGYVTAALVNEKLDQGLGLCIRYRKEQLPNLIEWKMMGQGLYVLGIEPANCLVEGRAKERERGTLQFLEPGERREYTLEIRLLTSQAEITELREQLEVLRARS